MRRALTPLALSTTVLLVGVLLMSAPFVATLLAATQDRLPTGNGTFAIWDPSGAATEWEAVDDAIGSPDDDTTYMFIQDLSPAHLFTFAVFNVTSASITNLTIKARCKNSAGDVNSLAGDLLINSVEYSTSPQSLSGTYTEYAFVFTTNPATSSAWTEDEIEGVGVTGLDEFGVVAVSNGGPGEEERCTQVYATVNYVASGGTTARGFMGFF